MQAAVDAAALAAAQSMPDQPGASAKATEYWLDNSKFIQSQGQNVSFAVTYPPGNKRIAVRGEAEIPTWFAKFFGVDHWDVWAEGDAESQVLDIAVVHDISGSMCYDSFDIVEQSLSFMMSPGRLTPAGGFAFPRITNSIAAGGPNSITIQLNDVRIFTSTTAATTRSNFGTSFNSATPYWQRSISGSLRAGTIQIDNELFRITAVNVGANQLTVTRAQQNQQSGVFTTKDAHPVNREVRANRTGFSSTSDYCQLASYNTPTTTTNGPAEPFDAAVSNSQDFTTLFDPAYDKIGLASYSTTATTLNGLTSNHSAVRSSMDSILWPAGSTNIAHGLSLGRQILDGSGKRANAVRVIVLLTDGIPNVHCTNGYSGASCTTASSATPGSCPATSTSITHAINQATAAAAADITVYTIGLGSGVLDCVLQNIADAGNGKYYKAPTPAQLDDAFEAIAEQTHIALVR